MPEQIEPDELAEVLVWIQSTWHRGWTNKVRILQVIGRAPGGFEISYAELAERIGSTRGTTQRLVQELVDGRVLERLSNGGGGLPDRPRYACHRVIPNIRRWGTEEHPVPWRTTELAIVERFAFHGKPPEYIPPRADARNHGRNRASANGESATKRDRASANGESATKRNRASANGRKRENPGEIAHGRPRSSGPAWTSGSADSDPSPEVQEERDRIRSVVLKWAATRAGVRYIYGAPKADLEGLADRWPVERIRELLDQAPPGLGPATVAGWLRTELVSAAAATVYGTVSEPDAGDVGQADAPGAAPEPAPRPALAEYQRSAEPVELADRAVVSDLVASTRARLGHTKPTPPIDYDLPTPADGTMAAATSTSEGS